MHQMSEKYKFQLTPPRTTPPNEEKFYRYFRFGHSIDVFEWDGKEKCWQNI